jgi:prolyl-tRNA synthetase
MTSPARPDIFRFMSADVAGKTHVTFLFLFLSGKPDFFCVNDDDKVAGVHVWRENRFVFAAQQVGSLNGDAAKHLAFGIDEPPLLWNLAGFGGEGFHLGRKEHGTYGSRQHMSTSVRLPQMSHMRHVCPMAETSNPTPKTAISPRRDEDFPEWYQQVIRAAELAEPSDVRGCMVIRPWGYGIWENMQRQLDAMFRATGHRNAYFPLFIPLSYFAKEAEHVEGFAKECAVVTHTRLEADSDGKLKPGSPLAEPLVIRPTSETIIGASYARWVQSYRDLPILINQWANVVRWEMRPRLFLRTTEFLWQEGHTVHETEAEACAEAKLILDIYQRFARDYLAVPVFSGEKSESERFPGAVQTLTIEAIVQDRKAIQAGTSHFLGQNFSRASAIQFQNREGKQEFGWTTSWGVSTRLVGTVVMMHGDDDGVVLPPRVAPTQIIILPITPKEETRPAVLEACDRLATRLHEIRYADLPIEIEVDRRDLGGGVKNWEWIKKGVPLRVEIGPRDLEKNSVAVSRRDQPVKSKSSMPMDEFAARVPEILASIQDSLYARAKEFRDANTHVMNSKKDFYDFFTAKNPAKPEIHGGFALAHWNGSRAVEEQIKNDLKVTIRVIPLGDSSEPGQCIFTGEPSVRRVVWAKSY